VRNRAKTNYISFYLVYLLKGLKTFVQNNVLTYMRSHTITHKTFNYYRPGSTRMA